MNRPAELERLIDGLGLFPDWEERYRALIDMGRKLVPLTEAEKSEEHRVRGCVSQVWLVEDPPLADPVRLRFRCDSDSFIVKGLLSILMTMYAEQTPEDILGMDSMAVFRELGLDRHLSPLRSNGLYSIDREIKKRAAAHAAAEGHGAV